MGARAVRVADRVDLAVRARRDRERDSLALDRRQLVRNDRAIRDATVDRHTVADRQTERVFDLLYFADHAQIGRIEVGAVMRNIQAASGINAEVALAAAAAGVVVHNNNQILHAVVGKGRVQRDPGPLAGRKGHAAGEHQIARRDVHPVAAVVEAGLIGGHDVDIQCPGHLSDGIEIDSADQAGAAKLRRCIDLLRKAVSIFRVGRKGTVEICPSADDVAYGGWHGLCSRAPRAPDAADHSFDAEVIRCLGSQPHELDRRRAADVHRLHIGGKAAVGRVFHRPVLCKPCLRPAQPDGSGGVTGHGQICGRRRFGHGKGDGLRACQTVVDRRGREREGIVADLPHRADRVAAAPQYGVIREVEDEIAFQIGQGIAERNLLAGVGIAGS